jgi:hypothetical protein
MSFISSKTLLLLSFSDGIIVNAFILGLGIRDGGSFCVLSKKVLLKRIFSVFNFSI